jgi:hypothetical protein
MFKHNVYLNQQVSIPNQNDIYKIWIKKIIVNDGASKSRFLNLVSYNLQMHYR